MWHRTQSIYLSWRMLFSCLWILLLESRAVLFLESNSIFILSKRQPDSATYSSSIEFIQGWVRLNRHRYRHRVTLLTFDPLQFQHNRTFDVVYYSERAKDLTAEKHVQRSISRVSVGTVQGLFNEHQDSLMVLVNVNLPLELFVPSEQTLTMDSEHGITGAQYNTKAIVGSVYELFTQGQTKYKTRLQFGSNQTGPLVRVAKHYFDGPTDFHYNFRVMYSSMTSQIPYVSSTSRKLNEVTDSTINIVDTYSQNALTHDTENVITIAFGNYYWKLVAFIHHITLYSVDYTKAESVCSGQGMNFLTVRSYKEARAFSRRILYVLNFIVQPQLYYAGDVRVAFGLRRDTKRRGRRFHWTESRDLLYSYWAAGEPRHTDARECAVWTFVPDLLTNAWKDGGWYSSGCASDHAEVVLCHRTVSPSNTTLKYTGHKTVNVSKVLEKGTFGVIGKKDTWGKGLVVSLSFAVVTGFLQDQASQIDNLQIYGLVRDKVITSSDILVPDILNKLNAMTFLCGENDDTSVPMSRVPFSQVCDGRVDCSSGSDELICGAHGFVPCSPTEFTCESQECIPLEARCDLLSDCQDGTDERDCELARSHRECSSGRRLPRSWFNDGQEDCSDGSDESSQFEPCVFICNRTECVTGEMLNDAVVDCAGPEGPLDETLGALASINCTADDNVNNWAPKCVLMRDNLGEVIGCRDFQHLQGCEEFTCPEGFVKCPETFCIPLAYIHDGKEDCDKGEDEGPSILSNIENVFQCTPAQPQFVTLQQVCDNRKDCAHGEDELDCGFRCSPGFVCLTGAISAVPNLEKPSVWDFSFIDHRTRYLDLSGVSVPDFFSIYPQGRLAHVLNLNVSGCGIESLIGNLTDLNEAVSGCKNKIKGRDFKAVQKLDLRSNNLKEVPYCSKLHLMGGLEELTLSNNPFLSTTHRLAFRNNKKLRVLDLSFTGITKLPTGVFDDLHSLTTLSLTGSRLTVFTSILPSNIETVSLGRTPIASVGKDIFSKVTSLRELQSPTYKLCCPAVLGPRIPSHVCHLPDTGIINSCTDLIVEIPLRVLLWVVSLSILAGNILTLVYRCIWDRGILKKSYGLFVSNLIVSDLLMGIYLLIIAVADTSFRGSYVLHDYEWTRSPACHTAGVLATLSSITSTIFISLITADRYLSVRYPFREIRFTIRTTIASAVLSWLFGLSTAVLPLMPFAQDWKVFSSSGICLGLPLQSERLPGWQYSATLFVGLNVVLFLFIGIGQSAIFETLKTSGKQTRRYAHKGSQRQQDFTVAKNLSLVVVSNFICWFPIITMGVVALSGQDLGEAAYRWTAVVVLPINSALNPLLYTMPALKKRLGEALEERGFTTLMDSFVSGVLCERTSQTLTRGSRTLAVGCCRGILAKKRLGRQTRTLSKKRLLLRCCNEMATLKGMELDELQTRKLTSVHVKLLSRKVRQALAVCGIRVQTYTLTSSKAGMEL